MAEVKTNASEETENAVLKSIIEDVSARIENSCDSINNRELINLCQNYVQTVGTVDPHLYHEIAEASLNLLIKRRYAKYETPSGDEWAGRFLTETIKPFAERLPTQTWRSSVQTIRQQFSTPPGIAFLLWHLMNCREMEAVLEPSAGTGSLIVWAGNSVCCNEIDSRRRRILRALGFAPTAFDAEFINDYLSPEIQPDCLLMNPPFSSSGGRTRRNSSKYGFRHVESALERLRQGGKFGIILGEAGGLDTKTGIDFWRKLSQNIKVKAIIKISGREYYKNGTTVDVNLIIGEKLHETQKIDWHTTISQIICISARTVEEALEKTQKLNLRLNQ